ncbi:MAG: exodeoxyribonuclease III [Rhodobacterales bacterium]|nr:exodeoxyribonuclease III [Rhodobacterales bacterium]
MSLTIATWNVNSIRIRLDHLARVVARCAPDVLCLQETKVTDDLFPTEALAGLGYPHQVRWGMKAYNGVAILSRRPLTDDGRQDWAGRADCRHVWATVDGGPGLGPIRVHSLYLPAGGDRPDPEANPKFAHKLRFLRAQARWWKAQRDQGPPAVLAGDFNVAPLESDVWSHARLRRVVTHTDVERDLLTRMMRAGGWEDAVCRLIPPPQPVFTWWSYRTPDGLTADKGRRLDHLWVSRGLAERVSDVTILKETRAWPTPSDHVPVVVTLA